MLAGSSVSVIIVYFRSADSIGRCVDSLRRAVPEPIEIIVVANSPVEEDVASNFRSEHVRLEQLDSNLGFAAACNIGASLAVGTHLLFVNPDVTCDVGSIAAMVRRADGECAVGPRILGLDGSVERSVKRRTYVSASVLIARELIVGRWLHLGAPRPPRGGGAVDILSGACFLVPREAHALVGGFDERFFLYGEDVDYSCELARLGIPRVYEPAAVVRHAAGTGGGGWAPDETVLRIKGREARRSHALLLEKHRGLASRRRYERWLRLVLRARAAVGVALRRPAEVTRARSALDWLANSST